MNKKDLSKTLGVIAFLVYLLQMIIMSLSGVQNVTILATTQGLAVFVIGLAVAFIFAKNHVVEKVGYIIFSIEAIVSLAALFNPSSPPDLGIVGIFSIILSLLLLVSAVIFLIRGCLTYFGYTKEDNESGYYQTNKGKIQVLKRWKKLTDANKISVETYDKIRKEVLKSDGTQLSIMKVVGILELIENDVAFEADLVELLK